MNEIVIMFFIMPIAFTILVTGTFNFYIVYFKSKSINAAVKINGKSGWHIQIWLSGHITETVIP